jgi:hypothetical protein
MRGRYVQELYEKSPSFPTWVPLYAVRHVPRFRLTLCDLVFFQPYAPVPRRHL